MEAMIDFSFLKSKNIAVGDCSQEKSLAPWKKSYDKSKQPNLFDITNDINAGTAVYSESSWNDSLTISSRHSEILELWRWFHFGVPVLSVSSNFHIVRAQIGFKKEMI